MSPLPLALQCGQAIRYIFIPLHFIKDAATIPHAKKAACFNINEIQSIIE
jgi:hypothetical protein